MMVCMIQVKLQLLILMDVLQILMLGGMTNMMFHALSFLLQFTSHSIGGKLTYVLILCSVECNEMCNVLKFLKVNNQSCRKLFFMLFYLLLMP